jgi:hypothetical protein
MFQQSTSRLQTTSANLWTFSLNITSPLWIHLSLLNPAKLRHYRVTCTVLLPRIKVYSCYNFHSSLSLVLVTYVRTLSVLACYEYRPLAVGKHLNKGAELKTELNYHHNHPHHHHHLILLYCRIQWTRGNNIISCPSKVASRLAFRIKSWHYGTKTWTYSEHLAPLFPVSCSCEGTMETSTLTKKPTLDWQAQPLMTWWSLTPLWSPDSFVKKEGR